MRCLFNQLRFLIRTGERHAQPSPPDSHVENCPGCQEFARASRDLEKALEQEQPGTASPEFHQRIMNSVRVAAERTQAVSKKSEFALAVRFRLAMAGTVAALIALMLFTLRPPAPTETAAPAAAAESTLPDLNALIAAAQPESFVTPIEVEFEFLQADLRRATDFGLGHLLRFAALPPEED